MARIVADVHSSIDRDLYVDRVGIIPREGRLAVGNGLLGFAGLETYL